MSKLIQLSDSDGSVYPIGKFAELLWTNQNISEAFENQTISVNVSYYDFVLIIFRNTSDRTIVNSFLLPKGLSSYVSGFTFRGGTKAMSARQVTVYTDSIVFGHGYTTDSVFTETIDDTCMTPYKIYGIR